MSNKLSKRRAVVMHPKICVAASCPPPPPPTAWPPATFPLLLEYTCIEMMGPCEGGDTIDMDRDDPLWNWEGNGDPPESLWGSFQVDDFAHTAELTLSGWNDQWGTYWLQKSSIPIIWNTPTLYVISEWDTIDWWLITAVATFTF